MANIPLVQIPNAPQTGNGAVLTDPSAIRSPNFGRAGAMISNATNMLRMDKLPAAAFDAGGMGAGLEALGSAGSNAAAAFGDLAARLGRANDEAKMADLDLIKSDVVSRFTEETMTKPANQWLTIWTDKYEPELVERASKLPMSSPLGTSKRDNAIKAIRLQSAAEIRGNATKATVESYRQSLQNKIQRDINEGRDEEAMTTYKRGAAAGLWTEEEAEEGIIKLEQERKISTWRGYIQQKPAEARRVLRDAQTNGQPPKGLRPEEVMQLRREAEGQHGQLLQDMTNSTLERLETNSAAVTDEDIENAFTDPRIDAPRELIDKIKAARSLKYADTPQGKAEKDEYYSDLWQKLFAYDAEKDSSMSNPDTFMREYQKLQQEIIATAPEGERKPFLDKLNESVSKAKEGRKDRSDQIAAGLTDLTKKLADWGQLGDDGGWKKEKKGDREVEVPQDWQQYGKVQSKRNEITTAVRQMLRENPDLTEEEAYERYKGILEDKLDGGAKFMRQPDEESWWQKLVPFVQGPMADNPNVVTAGLSWGSSSLTEGLDKDEPLPAVQSMPPQGADVALSLPPAKQPIANQITNMATQEGLGQFTPHLMLLVAQESNFNPNQTISTSSARGLFQLLDDDRKRYGSDSTLDGQIRAGLAKTKENIEAARRALGRDPDPFELYVVHYQGIGAGPAILRNPDGDFRQTLDATGGKGHASKVMKANPWLVRDGVKTNQDFIDWVRQRLSKKAADLGMA